MRIGGVLPDDANHQNVINLKGAKKMKYSSEDISALFEDARELHENSSQSHDVVGHSYSTCPAFCESEGGEDWWC